MQAECERSVHSFSHPLCCLLLVGRWTLNDYRLKVGRCTRSVWGTGSNGFPDLRHAASPPADDKSAKSVLSQHKRHTGASRFARSSAVQVDVFIPGKCFDFLREVIRLQSNRPSNAVGTRIVVTVTAHIGQQNLSCILSL
jgi:hypothetical protein